MDVSVVIRTKNEADCIGATLESLNRQAFGGEYEVLIVDSGSTDATLDIAEGYDTTVLNISSRKFSYGRALNLGAGEATGEFIVNLSAHAVPTDGNWLANLISGFEDSGVAGVYGRQISEGSINPFEALKNRGFFGEKRARFTANQDKSPEQIHFSNSNAAIRKTIWEKFRFNEEVGWAEDIVWQKEVLEAGLSIVYTPDAAVYHTHPVDLYRAYKSSKDCSHALALMNHKRKTVFLVLCDAVIMLGFLPGSVFENLRHVMTRRYFQHLPVTPLYVASAWLGWLFGRCEYRLDKPCRCLNNMAKPPKK
jgi:glycosyltransferase involved in cell wall biosynthesis